VRDDQPTRARRLFWLRLLPLLASWSRPLAAGVPALQARRDRGAPGVTFLLLAPPAALVFAGAWRADATSESRAGGAPG
jgi:hypothetical protein